jgi:hypothetical protein
MSANVTTNIICDSCRIWGYGITSNRVRIMDARRTLKNKDWYSYLGLDFCPDCISKRKHTK